MPKYYKIGTKNLYFKQNQALLGRDLMIEQSLTSNNDTIELLDISTVKWQSISINKINWYVLKIMFLYQIIIFHMLL